jgi:hypothetical protein
VATNGKWNEPAELSGLMLDVDNRNNPKLVILIRGRFELLRVIPYQPLADLEEELVGAVTATEVSIIRSLISTLTSQLASRKTGWAA